MRFFSSITTTLALATGIAVAADRPQPVTYLNGNIEGFSQNAGGTLELRDTKAMVLRSKDANVEIPYSAVSMTGRKTVAVLTQKDPLYKVWSLHKRLLIPVPLEEMAVAYKDKNGTEKTVTIEMEKKTADRVQVNIERAAQRKASDAGAWWGDSLWKTSRNKDQWGGAGVVAQRE
jgi:hypothetical protein